MPLLDLGSGYVLLLTLVLVRTSGIVLIAPIYGTNEVPPTVRALLAFAFALLAMPVAARGPVPQPATLVEFGVTVAAELLIGLTLGLGITVFFSGFQLMGGIVGQMSGMSLGDVFNPGLNDNIPLFSHLLHLVAVAVYATIGGHRLLLGGLLDSFTGVPAGAAAMPDGLEQLFVELLHQSFQLGLRAAAPAIVSLLMATIVLGLVSRSLPQLNIFALGFGFNAIVTFSVLTVSLGGVAWLLQDHLATTLDLVGETLGLAHWTTSAP